MLDVLNQTASVAVRKVRSPRARPRERSGARSTLLNVVLYQAGWFGCVLAAAAGRPWLAIAAALAAAGVHVLLAVERRVVLAVFAVAAVTGLVVDSLTVQLGILEYSAPLGWPGFAPLWIVALWLQFGMTIHFCFAWLSGRYGLAALLGGIGGPLSFAAGERLGAAEISSPAFQSLLVLGILWAVALPFLLVVADRLASGLRWRGRYRFEGTSGAVASPPSSN